MARLVKLPSGAVFREKLQLGTNYYRPKDMFGLNVLSDAIDFADKVAKSEGLGTALAAGERVYDKFAQGDTQDALRTAAEARVAADQMKKPSPMASPSFLFPERVAGAQQRMAASAGQQGITAEQAGTQMGRTYQVREDETTLVPTPSAKAPAPAAPAVPQPAAQPTASPLDMKPQGNEGQVYSVPMGGKDNLFIFQGGKYRPLTALEEKEFAAFGSLGGETPEQVAATEKRLAQFAVEQGMAPAPQAAPAPAPTAPAAPPAPPAQAPAPPSGTGTSVAVQPPAPAQGPVSRPPQAKRPTAEPVPAGQPGGTPVAPVGEGTGRPEQPTTRAVAKQEVLNTIEQGLDAIQNEFARNAERAAATIDYSSVVLDKPMDATTQAEALSMLAKTLKDVAPKEPDQGPLNIPKKLSIEQLIGFARKAVTTNQQQEVLDAFSNNTVTGMYAPTIASRLTGDFRKPFLNTILGSFPTRSTPTAMHPVDAIYKLAMAGRAFQYGEGKREDIEAGLPQAQAEAKRAEALQKLGMAQQAAEKATEIRELLQARRIEILSKANKAMDDFVKEKGKKGGGAGQAPVDVRLWKDTNVAPIEKALDSVQAEKSKVEGRKRELQGKLAEARALAARGTAGLSVRSQAYRDVQEAKAKAAGYEAEIGAADSVLEQLRSDERELTLKANELREFVGANIQKKQPTLRTKEEGEVKTQSQKLREEEAKKKAAETPAVGERTKIPTGGKPTGGERGTKTQAPPPRAEAASQLKAQTSPAQGPQKGDKKTLTLKDGSKVKAVFDGEKWVAE